MFNNIGKKLKVVAVVFCWIGIVASVVFGIILIDDYDEVVGAVTLVVGVLSSWIGSFALYGFGQLVENSDLQTERMWKAQTDMEKLTSEFLSFTQAANEYMSKKETKQRTEPVPTYSPVPQAVNHAITPEKKMEDHSSSIPASEKTAMPLPAGPGYEKCKKCGTVQRSGRKVCWGCGALFVRDSESKE